MALEMLTALGLVAASFAATNFDNLALLTSWLLGARGHSTPILIGHLLGMFVLLVLSFIFGLAANFVPIDWIGYLGVIPIIMGLIGLKQLRGLSSANTKTESTRAPRTGLALPLSIATTQVANGVDTVLVFGPLFADSNETIDVDILIGFVAMSFVWFGLARFLGSHATRIKFIDHYGHWVAPIVMIIVGIYILSDTRTDVLLG